jgi:hypothetical protein
MTLCSFCLITIELMLSNLVVVINISDYNEFMGFPSNWIVFVRLDALFRHFESLANALGWTENNFIKLFGKFYLSLVWNHLIFTNADDVLGASSMKNLSNLFWVTRCNKYEFEFTFWLLQKVLDMSFSQEMSSSIFFFKNKNISLILVIWIIFVNLVIFCSVSSKV